MQKIIINRASCDDDFVGLRINGNVILISFPIGYDIDEGEFYDVSLIKEYHDDIRILLNSLDNSTNDYYDDGTERFAFSNAAYIIESYLKYGEYKENCMKVAYNGRGKINWKKTIDSVKPIYCDDNIIFDNYYSELNKQDENLITKIQRYCLNVSIKVIGWLYGIYDEIIDDFDMDDNQMLYALNKELMITNDDRKKIVLKEFINFIAGTSIVDIVKNKEISIGRYYYNKVWEDVLRNNIYRFFNKVDIYPRTYYCCVDGSNIINSSLLPDIVVEVGDTIIIIDAKYYSIGKLPQSSDICKQLFYGEYIKNKNKKKKILNLFVLPNNLVDEYQYLGYGTSDSNDDRIETYYMDIRSVLKDDKVCYNFINYLVDKYVC